MEYDRLIDRKAETDRITEALKRENTQFIIIYGRRRIGKSTLIKYLVNSQEQAIYFLSDTSTEAVQRSAFAKSVATVIDGFDKVIYPNWESLFRSMNNQLSQRIMICLDEFPYLVKSCEALPSIIQKLLNEKILKFDFVLCGSSQQLMHGYVLNRQSPLYGLANEIIKMQPIAAQYMREAMECDAVQAVEEFAIWGGVPRYWELRRDYPDTKTAIRKVLLDPQGPLMEEPQRLLRDDMRDTVQASTLLTIIGNGANKLSEIASRAGKEANSLSEPLGKLRDLGYISREVPFGDNPKKSKKGLYKIEDNYIRFWFAFVYPNRSFIESGNSGIVMDKIRKSLIVRHTAYVYEDVCRERMWELNAEDRWPFHFSKIGRWWDAHDEIDVAAIDPEGKNLILGECKFWQEPVGVSVLRDLEEKSARVNWKKQERRLWYVLFSAAGFTEELKQLAKMRDDLLLCDESNETI